MKKENENRGAALVTVLIAVTFMAVLASSLIYMAYMNYLTKAMRYGVTDDFYTDEFALDELSTTLQQVAADADSMDDARDDICDAVRKHSEGSFTAYDETYVENLIERAKKDASITVLTSDALKDDAGNLTTDSLIVDSDYIKLRGVQITATTAEGYTSTITSDITIYFPSTMPGTLDINDFSIITESRIDMSNGGSRVYSGNMFVQNKGSSEPALKIGNRGCMVLLSPQAMFDGDIVIGAGSALHITGNCTVYGTVTVESDGVLIVSGSLKHTGPINKASGATVIGIDSSQMGPQSVDRSSLLDSGVLTEQIFEKVQIYGYPTDNSSDKHFWEISFEDICTLGTGNVQYKDSTSVGGEDAWAYVYGIGQGSNIQSCSNALVMFCHDVNISSSMNFDRTTLLTSGLISYNNTQGTAYMTKMSDEAYEAAKDLLFYSGTAGSETQITLNNSGSNINFKVAYASGDMDDYDNAKSNSSSLTEPDSDGERVYVADSSGTNYLPIRYFISEKASEIITKIFAAPIGSQDQTNSMVIYELWSKD